MKPERVPTNKQFEINSFEKLCNVIDEDNFDSLTLDLIMWLAHHVKMMKSLRKDLPKKDKSKTNWELLKTTFIWIDDGEHEIKEVVLKNEDTGEVKTFKFNL